MWLLQEMQNNLFNTELGNNYLRFRTVLDSMNIDYTLVYYNANKELRTLTAEFLDDPDSEEILNNNMHSPYILHGSVRLDTQLKNDKNNILGKSACRVDFSNITEIIDEKEVLNVPIQRGKLLELFPIADEFIMRPVTDNKVINGGIFTEGQLFAMKKNAKKENNVALLNSELIITKIQLLQAEYRFFIINKKIITYSSYMIDNKFNITDSVPIQAIEYVENLLMLYDMGAHYVLDIALVDGVYKVLEFNGVGASGLYNCDEYKIVKELNELL